MCGRFALHSARERLATRFSVELSALAALPELGPRYNVAPSQPVLALRERQGVRVPELLRWGLVPHWAEKPEGLPSLINARIETLAERPAFRHAFRARRCLILADGFYEWQAKGRGSRAARTPYYVTLANGEPYAMAGLWEIWRPPGQPDAEPLRTCSIVTVPARPEIAAIHQRMPLILPPELEGLWLASSTDPEALLIRLEPVAGGVLRAHPVGFDVNAVQNDGPALIRPVPDPRPSLF
jgi:putative SOS response-associated peptidase YedK